MIPRLDSIENFDEFAIWKTTDGITGVTCEIKPIDIETCDKTIEHRNLEAALKALPNGIVVKIETTCLLNEGPYLDSSRSKALSDIGFRKFDNLIHFQTNRNPFLELLYRKRHGQIAPKLRIKHAVQVFRELGISLRPISKDATKKLFSYGVAPWSLEKKYVLKGHSYLGVVRLFKPIGTEISCEAMGEALSKLPAPYKFTVQFQKTSREETQIGLQKRFRQSAGHGKVSTLKKDATESVISETTLHGADLFEYEMLLTIERDTEKDLSDALLEAAGVLRVFGDLIIETVGVGPSFLATLPGIGMHVPLLELSSTLPVFFPIWRNGTNLNSTFGNSLVLHRRDQSLDEISLLDFSNQNANALIIGSSGKGKSALLGCLTESLLRDPQVKIIKVDVGGSHSKECELLGGEEYRINLETTQGLNPFALIGEEASESTRAIFGSFVESLVLEEGETRLPKDVKIEIDEMLQYTLNKSDSHSAPLSIDTLLKFQFSRSKLLSRWGSKGLYGKAFCSSQAAAIKSGGSKAAVNITTAGWQFDSGRVETREMNYGLAGTRLMKNERVGSRLRYFNFQDIFQAKEEDFARAVMASVLAVFNMEMWLDPESRLILICDETPFFIESCFDFFKTSSANVRKFGGSVILVAQNSKHLIFEGDTSLIENAQHRMLFSTDGNLREFQERFRLKEQDMALMSSLHFQSGKHSEFLYQNDFRSKAMRLRLTPEEYWRVTSSQGDRVKLETLRKVVPGLSTEEAIRCLIHKP